VLVVVRGLEDVGWKSENAWQHSTDIHPSSRSDRKKFFMMGKIRIGRW
jgi:hypothetical protein